MSVFGNQPAGTCHARGLRQCLDAIDRWARMAAAIADEVDDGETLAEMIVVEDIVRRVGKRLEHQSTIERENTYVPNGEYVRNEVWRPVVQDE